MRLFCVTEEFEMRTGNNRRPWSWDVARNENLGLLLYRNELDAINRKTILGSEIGSYTSLMS